jgi:para-aminobenzoate synthetase component I
VTWVDAEALFLVAAAQRHEVFWLDAGPDAGDGFSWIGWGTREDDPARVRAVRFPPLPPSGPTVRGPGVGGWVGWVDYDSGAAAAGAPTNPDAHAPGERWLRVSDYVVIDHAARRMLASGPAAAAAVAEAAAREAPAPAVVASAHARARHTSAEYAALIARCQQHIRDGDAYQLCLTTAFEVEAEIDAVEAYRRLRRIAPSHHGGFVRIGDAALASASPERYLELADGGVRTHPIKGTRPRGTDALRDAALAEELRTDTKERAENVMIVDLMRNDLSRVCAPGSVRVERLFEVESYPAVHQLVSTVAGRLRPGITLSDVVDAAFPAGSMTGAPKLSAMTILAALERSPRGVFAGCFGWVAADGAADLAMVIRSILILPDRARVGAGGGITWRSLPAAEVGEVAVKARAPLAALGASLPPGWARIPPPTG